MILVGISGKAEVGKDYLQKTVLQPVGFRPWSLAWHFKVWLVGQGKWTHDEVFRTKPPECRSDLQAEGTSRGRLVYGQDIWCDVAVEWLRVIQAEWGESRFVIPDVRFKNEVEAVQRLGGKVIRIHAPRRAAGSRLTAEQRLHQSEVELDGIPLSGDLPGELRFDGFVNNDVGDASLAVQMERLFDRFGWHDIASEIFGKVAV